MSFSTRLGCKRLRAIGVSNSTANRIVREVAKWVRCNGEEWTVTRLKNFKQAALNLMCSTMPDYKSAYIGHIGIIPKGPFKPLFRAAVGTEAGSIEWIRLLNACMIYSSMVLPQEQPPTEKQWNKFSSAVESSFTEMQILTISDMERTVFSDGTFMEPESRILPAGLYDRMADDSSTVHRPQGEYVSPVGMDWDAVSQALNDGLEAAVRDVADPYFALKYQLNGKRVPGPRNKNYDSREIGKWFLPSFLNPEVLGWIANNLDLSDPIFNALTELGYSDNSILETALTSMDIRLGKGECLVDGTVLSRGVGNISFLQEPGYKLRAVAVINALIQIALEPTKRAVFSALKVIPQDCTYDQRKADPIVQKWLSSGEVVHSVDLSDATSMFPLRLQMEVLRRLDMPDPWIRGLETACTMPFVVTDPTTGRKREIAWTRGAPLGLGATFGVFALTHHAIMQCLRKELHRSGYDPGDYRILGDDVVVRGSALNLAYRWFLGAIGCPVSESKCLSSSLAAEFAGKVITRDVVIPTWKWRGVGDKNFVDLAKHFGHQFLSVKTKLFRPKQVEVLKTIAYLPEELGGLGWNPRGISWRNRMAAGIGIANKLDKVPQQLSKASKDWLRRRSYMLLQSAFSVDPVSKKLYKSSANGEQGEVDKYLKELDFLSAIQAEANMLLTSGVRKAFWERMQRQYGKAVSIPDDVLQGSVNSSTNLPGVDHQWLGEPDRPVGKRCTILSEDTWFATNRLIRDYWYQQEAPLDENDWLFTDRLLSGDGPFEKNEGTTKGRSEAWKVYQDSFIPGSDMEFFEASQLVLWSKRLTGNPKATLKDLRVVRQHVEQVLKKVSWDSLNPESAYYMPEDYRLLGQATSMLLARAMNWVVSEPPQFGILDQYSQSDNIDRAANQRVGCIR
jgi:hypothetical protein